MSSVFWRSVAVVWLASFAAAASVCPFPYLHELEGHFAYRVMLQSDNMRYRYTWPPFWNLFVSGEFLNLDFRCESATWQVCHTGRDGRTTTGTQTPWDTFTVQNGERSLAVTVGDPTGTHLRAAATCDGWVLHCVDLCAVVNATHFHTMAPWCPDFGSGHDGHMPCVHAEESVTL